MQLQEVLHCDKIWILHTQSVWIDDDLLILSFRQLIRDQRVVDKYWQGALKGKFSGRSKFKTKSVYTHVR